MRKRGRYEITKEVWVCPHCQHEHNAAELLRLDNGNAQCAGCGKTFDVKDASA
jgi:transcription elongation factor Elf1